MSFKMPTGKKLDSMLDKLSAKDIKEIRAQFELDVQKENQKETDMPNKETMSSIYEAIADMSDHHLKVASSYEELEKILDERNMKMSEEKIMQVQKVYDRKYNGRRIIVMWHSIGEDLPEEYKDDFMKWYCGYMEILAADKDYTTVNENENPADESCVEELYPNAIGGVTWVGYLPQEGIDNNNQYIGFDTNHYFPNEYQPTLKDVVRALHDMVDKDQVAINGGKQ